VHPNSQARRCMHVSIKLKGIMFNLRVDMLFKQLYAYTQEARMDTLNPHHHTHLHVR
jgi:hypothetical protein